MSLTPAFSGELMLAGWSETHNGGAKVTFWLPDQESLAIFRHLTVKKGNTAGHRFMAVLVEIGDDEHPAQRQGAGPLVQSAAMHGKNPQFWDYVEARRGIAMTTDAERETMAIEFIRDECGVPSRALLDSDPNAAQAFRRLMADFNGWLQARRAPRTA